ncbi:MAG: dTMP kinase [Mahellales bacterium]|jgi:dTMP kinase
MRGKLIIIEAGDGSGKATQTLKLYERLCKEGYRVKKVEYPNYDSPSSALIKMYLKGEFGTDPDKVNPYAASAFYAVDRYASYIKEWKHFYDDGGIVLADRYTTSNMVHQAAKITDQDQRLRFLDWLWDFEFNLFKLPQPDCVIFLDVPPSVSSRLMASRANKFTGQETKDIHESSLKHLQASYDNALMVAKRYGWIRINCVQNGRLKAVDEIHDEIYKAIKGSGLKS